MLLQSVQVVGLGEKAYGACATLQRFVNRPVCVSRTVLHRTCTLLPASLVMPRAKAKVPTIVQTQQDQKGRSEKQSACSCQMQNVLNASEPKRTFRSKASMAVHLRAEAVYPGKLIGRDRAGAA